MLFGEVAGTLNVLENTDFASALVISSTLRLSLIG